MRRILLSLWLLAGLVLALPASALTIDHGVFSGATVTFGGPNNGACLGGVCETTSSAGDPDILFGAPTVVGDQLLFFPSAFSASALGAGGLDTTSSQLQVEISSKSPSDTIDVLALTEFGDAVLTGTGTSATGTFVGMSGFVTVLEAGGVGIAPVIIPFLGSFSPTDLLVLPGDQGTTLWTGAINVDIAAQVPNATKLVLSFDNTLTAASEAGTTAMIQKKVVSGPGVVVAVPEPGVSSLLLAGLLAGLGARRRIAR